jgi:hypothetical protein
MLSSIMGEYKYHLEEVLVSKGLAIHNLQQ